MKTADLYKEVLERFEHEMPMPETELHYANPFQLLIAVILSAQCTDRRVNMVTPELFRAYPTPQAMAKAEPEDIYEYIKSISYPNNKAKALCGMARALMDHFDGQVPSEFDDLLSLPGVGRKTANVMLAVVYGKSAMAVDTHVFRVSNRIGLTNNSKTPLATERTLMRHIPAETVPKAHHWLILHGRYMCTARRPDCGHCYLADLCKHHKSQVKDKSAIDSSGKQAAKSNPKK
ncbi:MAG: endonuclease III [Bacteroidales bacterium]|nr:endonuclease III [Bacteroidales bacterium]